MDKSSNSPIARLPEVEGLDGRFNDVIFCGSEGQQHVVFFPGDVQVSTTIFLSVIYINIEKSAKRLKQNIFF